MGLNGVQLIRLTKDRGMLRDHVNTVKKIGYHKIS